MSTHWLVLITSLFLFSGRIWASANLCTQAVSAHVNSIVRPIMSSVDTPTHLVMNLGDYRSLSTIEAAVQALNPEVVPVIMVNTHGLTTPKLIALKANIEKLNPKTEFVDVDLRSDSSIDLSYLSNWSRDFMPELVTDGSDQHFVGFRYHRGDVYASFHQSAIARRFGLPLRKINLILEGGAYRAGPDGALYISEVVVQKNSKANIEKMKLDSLADWDSKLPLVARTKKEIEGLLKKEFKVREVVWLKPPPQSVEATGHADMHFQFIKGIKNTVVVVEAAYNARPESYSADFAQKVHQANLAFEKMTQVFSQRGFHVIRQKADSTENIFYSPVNSVFDGVAYLTTNTDFRDTHSNTPFKADPLYSGWNAVGKTVGPFAILKVGGGIHCLTKQYHLINYEP